jgi:DNA-binding LytR/AlgR family response regulator
MTKFNNKKIHITETENKYTKVLIERNSYLLEKETLEQQVKELEKELYYCRRNRMMESIVERNK